MTPSGSRCGGSPQTDAGGLEAGEPDARAVAFSPTTLAGRAFHAPAARGLEATPACRSDPATDIWLVSTDGKSPAGGLQALGASSSIRSMAALRPMAAAGLIADDGKIRGRG
jgi:hypothetical protein